MLPDFIILDNYFTVLTKNGGIFIDLNFSIKFFEFLVWS